MLHEPALICTSPDGFETLFSHRRKKMSRITVKSESANHKAKQQRTPIPLSCMALKTKPRNRAAQNKYLGTTPLHTAKTAKQVRDYIAQGMEVNCRDLLMMTPLHTARTPAVARALIKAGADVNARDKFKNTPLHKVKNVEIAKILVQNGAIVNLDNNLKQNPLFLAKTPELIEFFKAQGLRVSSHDIFGRTPIYYAQNVKCAECLMPSNFRALRDTDDGYSPLHYTESLEVAQYFITQNANINCRDRSARTPLITALQLGYNDIALALIQAGANVSLSDCNGKAPIHYANADLIPALLKAGADINQKDLEGNTPLHCTTNTSIINTLIENGADLTATNGANQSCLEHLIDIGYKFCDFFSDAS